MAPGSVIVDLAAERGGNCELTKAGETVVEHGVTILGPTNLPSTSPYHASQMYAKNITTFLLPMVKEGKLTIDTEDEIIRETLVARDGAVVNARSQRFVEIISPRPMVCGNLSLSEQKTMEQLSSDQPDDFRAGLSSSASRSSPRFRPCCTRR